MEHDVDNHRLGWHMLRGSCPTHGSTTFVYIKRWLCLECDFEAWVRKHYGV